MSASSNSDENKVTEPVTTAEKLPSAGKKQESQHALGQVAATERLDEHVMQSLSNLGVKNHVKSLVDLCEDFSKDINSEEIAASLIDTVKSGEYSQDDAETALKTLFNLENDNVTKNSAIGFLLANPHGQRAIAVCFKDQATEVFHHLWDCGDAVLSSFTTTLLLQEVWATDVIRIKAVQDAFQLVLAKLLEPAQDAAVMGMRLVGRLISTESKQLVVLLDAGNMEVILNMLDIQRPATVRSQALMVTAKILETIPDRGQHILSQYVTSRATAPNTNSLVLAFSVASAIFPILQSVASAMFLSSGFLDSLVSITKNVDSARLARASFELLSAACVDKACREAVAEKCAIWLQMVMTQQGTDDIRGRAALVLCKIGTVKTADGRQIDIDYVAAFLMELLRKKEESLAHIAVEGLVYVSRISKIKRAMCDDTENIECLVAAIQDFDVVFGGLTIVSHLVAIRSEEDGEQQRLADLKAYANQSQPDQTTSIEEDARIAERCSVVVKAGIIPAILIAMKQPTPGVLRLISNIALALTKNRKDCGKLIQQGLLNVILRLSSIETQDNDQLYDARHKACHALACILIPVNPNLILNNSASNRPLEAIVRPLNELIQPTSEGTGMQGVPPTVSAMFDGLRAMTNIASCSESARQFITRLSFDNIESHLWSNISRIRQAATECILNLTESTATVVKYFSVAANGSPLGSKAEMSAARSRLLVITALTTSTTRGIATAATATLCNILAYGPGAASFMLLPPPSDSGTDASPHMHDSLVSVSYNPAIRLVSLTIGAVANNDHELLARAVVALCALVSSSDLNGQKKVKEVNGHDILKTLRGSEVISQHDLQNVVQNALDELAKV